MRSSAKPQKKPLGFTLIETLVAIAIAAIGLLTIFELFPAGFAASAKSQSRVTATTIGSDILAACRRILQDPADANFSSLCHMTKGVTEAQGLKFVSTQNVLGGVTGDSSYYYKIWIEEVVDPYQKHLSAISSTENIANYPLDANYALPDVVGLRRITVFVRGPFTSNAAAAGGANDPNWTNPGTGTNTRRVSGAVEVRMATYVANYKLATTNTVFQCGPGALDTGGTAVPSNRIYLTDATATANFNIYNVSRLTTEEKDDTGPPSTMKWSTMWDASGAAYPAVTPTASTGNQKWWGLNELKMDNIWIGNMHDYNYAWASEPTGLTGYGSGACTFTGESNKIIGIGKDSAAGVRNGKYYLELLHPIRGTPSGANWVAYPVGTPIYGICGVQVTP